MGDVQQQARLKLKCSLELSEQLVTRRILYLAGFDGGKIWLGKAGAATDLIERQIQLLTLLPYYLPQRHTGNFTTKDFKRKRKV
jgi:hypothetical protein